MTSRGGALRKQSCREASSPNHFQDTKPLRWSVCFYFQRGIGAGSPLPRSSLQATNVACFLINAVSPQSSDSTKRNCCTEIYWQLLNSICQNVAFFSDWLSKWHKEIAASRLLQLTAWPSPWLPKHFWIQWQTDGYRCSFQADIYARRDWKWRTDKKLVCAYVFWTELFFYSTPEKRKCLYRWDAVWICLLLLGLLFVYERASSAFFH